jgi:RNA polymerase sigma factor (sigma-70 family)
MTSDTSGRTRVSTEGAIVAPPGHSGPADERLATTEQRGSARGGRQYGGRHSCDLRRASDGDVVLMAARGDERAWKELVNRFDRMVLRAAKRHGLNDAEAADARQITWLRLMTHAHGLRDPGRVGAWLATSARRQGLEMAVSREREVLSADPVTEHAAGAGVQAGVDVLVLREKYEPALERALTRLPASYRRLIELLSSDMCLSYDDAAKALGVPIGSIGPMRLRCLQILRRDPGLMATNG